MTKQEIFDKVAIHLLTQKKRSISESEGGCLYKGPNGLKCAVGCLFTGNFDTSELEGEAVFSSEVRCALQSLGVIDSNESDQVEDQVDLLSELQEIHDEMPPEDWRMHLLRLATEHNINTSAVTSFNG